MDLSTVKRDLRLLLTVLDRPKAGKAHCPFHHDRSPSMDIFQAADGVWLWKCHSGCGHGTVIDAVMKKHGLNLPGDALRVIERELGVKVARNEEIIEPRIDQERAEQFVRAAHDFLLGSFEAQEILLTKRGIADLGVVRRYRLGYLKDTAFREWPGWLHTGWVLPVTDADDRLVCVKFHHQGPRDPKTPKCMWCPFGTYPAAPLKPRHGTLTLWPPPEHFAGHRKFYLAPGELKALALLSEGLPATSTTAGESSRIPGRLLARLRRVGAKMLFVSFDDDPAGRKWRDDMLESLRPEDFTVVPFAYQRPAAAPPEAPGDDLDAEFAAAVEAAEPPPEPPERAPELTAADRQVLDYFERQGD